MDFGGESYVRVATKYPATTRRWFEGQGIQAECIKLNGAMEIAPKLGLASHIVALVSTGRTLIENALAEQTIISEVSARLTAHRAAFTPRSAAVPALVERLRPAPRPDNAAACPLRPTLRGNLPRAGHGTCTGRLRC